MSDSMKDTHRRIWLWYRGRYAEQQHNCSI